MKVNKLYVFFMIVISVLFFIEGEIVLNLAFYCGVFGTVIGIISLIVLYFGVDIEIEFSQDNYNTFDNYDFNLILINKLYIFVPFIGVNYISGDKLINKMTHINIHETKSIKNKIMFQYRGTYDLRNFKLEIKDIMFIFTKYKYLKSKPKVKVYPKIWGIRKDGINKLNYVFQQSISKDLIENDYLNVKDIRKYNYNDSYKRIHWKATSKTGQLYVKNYENFDNGKIKFFIDMNENIMKCGKKVEEKYIECTVSILSYIMDKHSKFEIHFSDDNNKVIFSNGKSEFGKIMEYLTNNKCIGEQNLFGNMLKNFKNIAKTNFTCIIIFKMDERVKDRIVQLKNQGIKCAVFYFEDRLAGKHLNEEEIQCFSMLKLIM